MMKDIKSHCNICDIYQHVKTHRHCSYRELKFISKSQNIFKVITMNFITELLSSQWRDRTYDVILVIIDVYTKYTWYLSCNEDITAKDLADLLYKCFFFFAESLKTLVTDWKSLFISKFWFSLCFLLNVKQHLSTAHHFQTDDQTECQNQMLEHYLHCYINYNQDDWVWWISLTQFVYNNIKHNVTEQTSAEILFETWSQFCIDVDTNSEHFKVKKVINCTISLQDVCEQLTEHLQKTHEMQKKYYNKTHTSMKFNVKDRVLVKTQNMNLLHSSCKLDHKYTDLFEIIVSWNKQIYKLKLSSHFRMIHLIFHIFLLESYKEKKNEQQLSSLKIIDRQDKYYIEKILD